LERKHPRYIGGQLSYIASRSLEYQGLHDLFAYGRTRDMASSFDAIEQATDWDQYAVLRAIKDVRKELHLRLSRGCRLLDVGCGTGNFIVKLQQQYPFSIFVGVDPSNAAIDRASQATKSIKNVTIMKQAAESMRFLNYFDIVYLGESLYATKNKPKVVSNCFRALKKGGAIAIVEGLIPNLSRHNNESRLIMGMQLDFALQGHRFMKSKELNKLLRDSGFNRIKFLHFGGYLYLITAMK
jgi:SAM-dependent methyltransferase